MSNQPTDDTVKNLLSDLAEKVSHLPEHLQATAFSILLQHSIRPEQVRIYNQKGALFNLNQQVTSFADYYHSFPSELKELEKLLVASSFAETQSEDRTYTIESAHTLLKDVGIELSNAGVFAKQLVTKKLAIVISKLGKKTFKYRVSLQGHNLLKELKENKE